MSNDTSARDAALKKHLAELQFPAQPGYEMASREESFFLGWEAQGASTEAPASQGGVTVHPSMIGEASAAWCRTKYGHAHPLTMTEVSRSPEMEAAIRAAVAEFNRLARTGRTSIEPSLTAAEVTPEMIKAALLAFRLDDSPGKAMHAALTAAFAASQGEAGELQRLRDEDAKVRQLCAEPDVTVPLARVVGDTLRYIRAVERDPRNRRRDINDAKGTP
jgi:hypothetical protein